MHLIPLPQDAIQEMMEAQEAIETDAGQSRGKELS